MTHSEHSPDQSAGQKHQPAPIELRLTPAAEEAVVFDREADGRLRLTFTGRTEIVFPAQFTAKSFLQSVDEGAVPLPTGSEELRREPRALQAEQASANTDQAPRDALESAVTDEKPPSSGLVLDATPAAVSEPHSAADKRSWEKSRTDIGVMPESENRKFHLIGNPAKILGYRVTRKTNTRIGDFVLATHPAEDATEYWRIRAFGDEAEKVRDQVEVGQKAVEATVYGPKYWKGRKKTQDGWEDTVVKGYHAGFVKVPRHYRQEKQSGETQPQQEN